MPKKIKKLLENLPSLPKKTGRSSTYSDELGRKICEVVATSSCGIRKICANNPDFPTPETIRVWRLYNDAFSAQYAKAKQVQADILAEDCIDIADDDSHDVKFGENGTSFNSEFAARSRIRIDTRKWLASKMLPKIYGNSKELEDEKEKNEELREEVRKLRAKLDEQNKRDY